MSRLEFFAAPFRRSSFRFFGLLLAIVLVILPAFPWFSQPPLPIAALWCAYGWAAEGADNWRAPTALALLGLLQDQMSGGPLGFYALIFVSAYLIGGVAARTMRSAHLISPWTGFLGTALGVSLVAVLAAPPVFGVELAAVRPFVVAALITVLLFPFVRPLYLSAGAQ